MALVTTDSDKSVVVAQLSQDQLAQAAASLKIKPDLFVGQDQYVLQAMGLNPSLAKTPYQKGTIPFAPGIAVASSLVDQKTVSLTYKIAARNIAIAKYKSNLASSKLEQTTEQTLLSADKSAYSSAESKLASTKLQAQAQYAANINRINAQNQQTTSNYNEQLMNNIESIGNVYDRSVAAQNIITSQKATTSTQLLRYNVDAAYNANKMTYTPISTALPTTTSVAPTTTSNSAFHSTVVSEVLGPKDQSDLQNTIKESIQSGTPLPSSAQSALQTVLSNPNAHSSATKGAIQSLINQGLLNSSQLLKGAATFAGQALTLGGQALSAGATLGGQALTAGGQALTAAETLGGQALTAGATVGVQALTVGAQVLTAGAQGIGNLALQGKAAIQNAIQSGKLQQFAVQSGTNASINAAMSRVQQKESANAAASASRQAAKSAANAAATVAQQTNTTSISKPEDSQPVDDS